MAAAPVAALPAVAFSRAARRESFSPTPARSLFRSAEVEPTGAWLRDPGDVIVMHPWIYHAYAPNCRETPRMMIRQDIYQANKTLSKTPR